MLNFAYEKPVSIVNAVKLLENNKNSRVYAGGTDLLLKIKHHVLKPCLLISINNIKELLNITNKDGYIYIGSGVKINDLLENPLLHENAPLLMKAAKEIGSPEIRNMATIGGNICSVGANCGACGFPGCKALSGGGVKACQYASSADLIPPLMAMDAMLLLVGGQGERRIPVRDFITPGRKIDIAAGEILKEIYFKPQTNNTWGYSRLSTSKAMGITIILAAAVINNNEDSNFFELSLALGGSFEKPLLVTGIDRLLKDKVTAPDLIEKIIAIAMQQLSFTDNLEMSLDYRKEMTGVLIREAIVQALGAQA